MMSDLTVQLFLFKKHHTNNYLIINSKTTHSLTAR